MTDPIGADPADCVQASGATSASSGMTGKAMWIEPKLIRLDTHLAKTAFNTNPDGDGSS